MSSNLPTRNPRTPPPNSEDSAYQTAQGQVESSEGPAASDAKPIVFPRVSPWEVRFPGQDCKVDLARPPPDLGLRVYQELCGYEVFKEVVNSSSARSRLTPALLRRRATLTRTAWLLGISVGAVSRIAKAFRTGGEAQVQALRWGRGRPLKNLFFTQVEIDHMVSRATLNSQIGKTLKDRAREFSQHFGKQINAAELRSFYRGRGITMQKPKQRLGPVDLGTPEEQEERIR